jgi:hypothetical protein
MKTALDLRRGALQIALIQLQPSVPIGLTERSVR